MLEIKGTKYFTLQEVAKAFAVGPQTVSRWRREQKLQGYRISERKFLFSENEIENMLKRDSK